MMWPNMNILMAIISWSILKQNVLDIENARKALNQKQQYDNSFILFTQEQEEKIIVTMFYKIMMLNVEKLNHAISYAGTLQKQFNLFTSM